LLAPNLLRILVVRLGGAKVALIRDVILGLSFCPTLAPVLSLGSLALPTAALLNLLLEKLFLLSLLLSLLDCFQILFGNDAIPFAVIFEVHSNVCNIELVQEGLSTVCHEFAHFRNMVFGMLEHV